MPSNTPPNPFDQAAVDKYLAEREAESVNKQRRAEQRAAELGDTPTPAEHDNEPGADNPAMAELGDSPTAEAVTMLNYWAAQGPEVYAEAVNAVLTGIAATASDLENANPADVDGIDSVLVAARLGKSVEKVGKALYNAGRGLLWVMVDMKNGKHTTPAGDKFTFKAGATVTRRVDYKQLETDYPEAYKAAVTTTRRDPNAPGTLTL